MISSMYQYFVVEKKGLKLSPFVTFSVHICETKVAFVNVYFVRLVRSSQLMLCVQCRL